MPYIPQVKVGTQTYNLKDSEARELISDLKSALNITKGNLYNKDDPEIETGGYYTSQNQWSVNDNFMETGYIPVIPGKNYAGSDFTSGKNQIQVCFYDSSKQFVSGLSVFWDYLTIPAGCAYVRLPIQIGNRENYSFVEGTDIPVAGHKYGATIELGTVHANAYYLNGNVLKGSIFDIIEGNLYNKDDPEIETGGYYNSQNQWSTNANFMETGYIPVTSGKNYAGSDFTPGKNQIQVCFYDSSKQFVSGLSVFWDYLTIPAGCTYVRLPVPIGNRENYSFVEGTDIPAAGLKHGTVAKYDDSIEVEDVKINGSSIEARLTALEQQSTSGTQWAGKTWYGYGTSLSNTSGEGKYPIYLAEMSGMIHVNKGISGGGIGNLGGYSTGQVYSAICNTTDGKTNADLITLETGANDVEDDVPLGTIYDTGTSTLAGCLNDCIRYLQANTNAQIVIIPSTPAKTNNITSASHKYYEWMEMIKQICEINCVYYINMNSALGYGKINSSKSTMYLIDNIHHTNLGGYVFAESIWYQLRNIPVFRTSLPE